MRRKTKTKHYAKKRHKPHPVGAVVHGMKKIKAGRGAHTWAPVRKAAGRSRRTTKHRKARKRR
jgi:hypothetical protein